MVRKSVGHCARRGSSPLARTNHEGPIVVAWHDLQRFLGRGKLVEEKSKEDPDVKYIKSIDNIDMENVILQGYRDTIQKLTTKINFLQLALNGKNNNIHKLELQIKGFSAVKQKLTELKIKAETAQNELTQLSDYLLNRKKSLKVRNNFPEGIEQRVSRLSSTLTEIYALILTLIESILDEPTGSNDTVASLESATNISSELYATKIPRATVPCVSGVIGEYVN